MRIEHWLYTLPLRVRSLFRRAKVEDELNEELQFHLELRMAQERMSGKSEEEAWRAALAAMDGLAQQKEECRDARRVHFFENLMRDVHYAARALRKNPGFTLVAVVTLALGIGANSAIFSVVDAALLRPLPYPQPDRLVLMFEMIERPNVVSYPNFADWERQSHSFVAMAAGRQNSFNLGHTGAYLPERIEGAVFSWGLFKTLGVQPALGRSFAAADDRVGAAPVAIISYGLWQRRFGGARDILNRAIQLDSDDRTIIGVMPAGFGYPTRAVDVWIPIQQAFSPDLERERGWHQLYVLARMKDGVTLAQATAEVDGIQRRVKAENPADLLGGGAFGFPLRDITTRDSRMSLYVLWGAVGCLLLIACVNISNLLLARGSQRGQEFSVRAALGANRRRLVQQLLTETILLSLMGSAAGLLLAFGLTSLLGAHTAALIQADDIDTSAVVRMDGWVVAFTVGISLLAGMAAGLLPARRSTRGDLAGVLKQGGRSATAGRGQQRLRTGLLSAEVALSMVLLVAAGLMIRSFEQLQRVQPGVRIQNLLTAGISLPDNRYSSREKITRFSRALLERLRALPGVRMAGLVNCLPMAGHCSDNTFTIEGHPLPRGQFQYELNRSASPEYFATAGIPLVRGRTFTEQDGRGFDEKHPHGSALIISESMARKYWPDGKALGKKIYFGDENSPRYEVIGIVGDVLIGLEKRPQPTMYTPILEGGHTDLFAVVRTEGDPAALASGVRRAISGVDADIPAFKIRTMAEIFGQSAEHRAFTAGLLGGFAGLALVLSAVGLYGVLSYLMAQRTAEIGIRMALGASRREVCQMVLMQGLRPTVLGLSIGLVAAGALTRAIESVLFGVKATDLATFTSVTALLLLVSVAACMAPAWRAVRIDPALALRGE